MKGREGDARCKNLKFFSFSSSSEEDEDFVESGRTCCIHIVGFSHLLD